MRSGHLWNCKQIRSHSQQRLWELGKKFYRFSRRYSGRYKEKQNITRICESRITICGPQDDRDLERRGVWFGPEGQWEAEQKMWDEEKGVARCAERKRRGEAGEKAVAPAEIAAHFQRFCTEAADETLLADLRSRCDSHKNSPNRAAACFIWTVRSFCYFCYFHYFLLFYYFLLYCNLAYFCTESANYRVCCQGNKNGHRTPEFSAESGRLWSVRVQQRVWPGSCPAVRHWGPAVGAGHSQTVSQRSHEAVATAAREEAGRSSRRLRVPAVSLLIQKQVLWLISQSSFAIFSLIPSHHFFFFSYFHFVRDLHR